MILSRKSKRRSPRLPAPEGLMESLEPRVVLHQVPMATGFIPLTQLEDRNNSVVRILTNAGRIDIELFDALVPAATNNFRNYITSGKFDEMFFHSLGNGVLQAGGYKFDNGPGLSNISPNAPIANGFSRSNLQRTLAMVPISSIQSDSQFIINLQDNPALNTASGGYTVFAKVIQGWDIVTTIAGYSVQNLNQQLLGVGTGPFTAVPVRPGYNPVVGPTEATLVKVIDIETIKAQGQAGYYQNTYVYPEGFRSNTTVERVDIVNKDLSNINYFTIIVRYENGERDQVLHSGQMAAGARFSFKINDANIPGLNLVRSNVGYAIEVRSTRAAAVTLDHRDTGVTLAESFYMTPQIPTPQFTRYNFPIGRKSATEQAYLLVQELDGKDVTINVLVYHSTGTKYIPITLEAFRRGGLNLNAFTDIPNGSYSIYVTCLTPFAAALSQYNTGTGLTDAGTAQGVQGLGRKEGALAGAYIATGGSAFLDFFYPGSAAIVIVDYTITLTNGTVITPSPVTLTQSARRQTVDLTAIAGLPRDAYFSIQYAERQAVHAVSVHYRSKIAGDEVSTPFQINSTNTVLFADGYTDPTLIGSNGMSETISIFNPYAGGINMFYQLLFQFSDGTQIFAPDSVASLQSLRRVDVRASQFPTVLSKINSDPAFRFYSVQVITAAFNIPVPIGGVVAQMTRIHNTWGQSLTTIPSNDPGRQVVYFDHPEFDG
ncbi:MAG: peptidylprolyl isomerase [Phycisphaeraceae bacterium]|nr:peptidylprolyl isomerase [Phycisphaeraceae bacterium]